MKKILLGTTGLIGAALLASAASAETPKVTLGGFSDFQAGYVSQDLDATGIGAPKDFSFRNDNEVSVHVDGKTDTGLGYGAVIDLEADTTPDADNQGVNAARTFTYLEGNWGRAELGGNKSAAATMRVDASSVAVATGGINGAWTYFVTNPAGTADFISTSKLVTEHGATDTYGNESTYNATKVTYYTPSFWGLQAGVSYTPGVSYDGTIGRGQSVATIGNTGYNDVIDAGLTWSTAIDKDWKLGLAGTYETANADVAGATFNTTTDSWNVGASLGYLGWQVAGSYGNWNNAALTSTAVATIPGTPGTSATATGDGSYWTAGLGYDAGPVGLSATYLNSTLDAVGGGNNDFSNLVFGADYKLAPGLTPYAEVSLFDASTAGAVANNNGTVVLVGTQIAF